MSNGERFQISEVISQTFAVLGRNLPILLLLALICLIIPPLLSDVLELSSYDLSRSATSFMEALRGPAQTQAQISPLVSLPLLVLSIVASLYFQASAMQIVMADLSGLGSTNDVFRLAWQRILPLFGVLLLVLLAMMVGSILLVVPGILVSLAFAVAVPVIVLEPGRSVMGALQRSRDLTRGYRWRIFLLGLLYTIACAMILALSVLSEVSLHLPITIWALTIGLLITVASSLVTAVGVAVLYFELRKAKDGGSASDMAAAFA